MLREIESPVVIRNVEKIEELCGYYLKMAKSPKKSVGGTELRLRMEEDILDDIVEAIDVVVNKLDGEEQENDEEVSTEH